MSYLDRYLKGSFRNAPFATESATTTFGRRVAVYEMPFDDQGVAHIDLGRAARKYQIRAVLVGQEYDKARDALITALETSGPGLLVHPYLGRVMVIIKDDITITESTEEGGCAEITFNAIEARDPLPVGADGLGLLDAIQSVRDAASNNFVTNFVNDAEKAQSDLDDAIFALRKVNNQIAAVLAVPGDLSARLDALSIEAASLLDTPRKLFDAVDGFLESLMASAGRILDAATQKDVPASIRSSAIRRFGKELGTSLGDTTPDSPDIATARRQRERLNRATMIHSFRASALANTVKALADSPPSSRNEALRISKEIGDAISDLADSNIDGRDVAADLYNALKDLESTHHDFMEKVAGLVGNTKIIKLANVTTAEVLAYRLYGDARRAQEILDRNKHIAHAGMIPGQVELEVPDK